LVFKRENEREICPKCGRVLNDKIKRKVNNGTLLKYPIDEFINNIENTQDGGLYTTGYKYGYGCREIFENSISENILLNPKMKALRCSYETLGNLLSKAENFAGLPNEKYSKFNKTTNYDYNNLKLEFAWELHRFQKVRKSFEDKFQCPYQFPREVSKERIINDINRYMKKTKSNQDIILFNYMIKIIK